MAYRRTERVVQRLNARRDSVVAAAHEIAAESGLAAVQIVPVAARAGIAAGTVYRYFPAKTDLVAALIEGVTAQECKAISRAAAAAPGPLSALAAGIVAFAVRAVRQRRLIWAVLSQPVDHDIEELRAQSRRALASEFERLIAAAVSGQNLPEQDAPLASVALVGALLEGLVGPLAADAKNDKPARDAVQALTLMALRGLGVVDARARGLVVQVAWPGYEAA
ncbi:MAG: TetR/AcrR family transcriptional regulator [Xanthobacteraceae bacterium]